MRALYLLPVRAITLTQPYASLAAVGAKRFETRSWRTNYRGLLALHAGVGLGPCGGKRGVEELLASWPFQQALAAAGVTPELSELPRGALLAVCELVEVHEIGFALDLAEAKYGLRLERFFGDYTPGRFGWQLENVQLLPEPLPCKGALGLWHPPAELSLLLQRPGERETCGQS